MGAKTTGLSRDLLIHPGEMLADILGERNISQAELALSSGFSEAFVSGVIAGKKDISSRFASALEYALGIPKSFWINLQGNYDAELESIRTIESITDEERECARALKEVVKHLREASAVKSRLSIDEKVLLLRKGLHINDLALLKGLVPEGQFRMSGAGDVNPIVLGAWLRLAQLQTEGTVKDHKFAAEDAPYLVRDLKEVMVNVSAEEIQDALRQVFSQYGISFAIVQSFKGAPVQGYVTAGANGTLRMAVTIRKSWEDILWFSILHEVGHLVNGDIDRRKGGFFDRNANNEAEDSANEFARDALIDPADYREFISSGEITSKSICDFAASQNVVPGIVVGRLHKEGLIPWNKFSNLKRRLVWTRE